MELEINRIALYLAWKLPPYYEPFEKMHFIDELRWLYPSIFTIDELNFIQTQSKTDEQYFSMCLSKANRKNKDYLEKLLDTIKVPKDARYVILDKEEQVIKTDFEIENIELKEKIKTLTKPLVITEWKTDVKILETAWNKLYPNEECPFDIIESWLENQNWSANTLKIQLNYANVYWKHRTIIWLFDNDKEWNEQLNWIDKDQFEKDDITKDVRKHKYLNIYWLLLQVPNFREKFISKTNITKRYFQIEHYFSDEILNKNRMIKEDDTLKDWIFEIWWSKDAFSKAIEKLNSKEFEHFKILFDRIKSYI